MGRGTHIILVVLSGFLAASGAWMVLELGGPRAKAIAKAAISKHVLDGLAVDAGPSSVPALHLHDAGNAGAFQGVEYLGTTYHARLDPMPGAQGWECAFTGRVPFAAMTRSRLLMPGRLDMLGRAWALQVAGDMGVVVPLHRIHDVHVDGRHVGLMEWMELPGSGLERVRGLGMADVALMAAGDVGAGIMPPPDTGLPGDTVLRSIHHLLRDTLLEASVRDGELEGLLDLDAWMDCAAALQVLGGAEASPQLLIAVAPSVRRAYPVLADAHLAPVTGGDALQDMPLLRWLRADAERARRIAATASAHMARLASDDGWQAWALDRVEFLWPAVVAQRDRRARITEHPQDVLPYGASQWRHAHEALLAATLERWRGNGDPTPMTAHTNGTEQAR